MGGKSSKAPEKPANSRITEHDRAVLQLKQMRDKLKQYRTKIELKLDNEKQLARQLLKDGKVDKAKLLLKKKKFYENNLQNTDNQLDNIDQLITNIEFKQVEHQVVNSLKIGNDCLKKLHQLMSIDEIEDIMDDTREAIEHQRQIDELLGTQINDQELDEINQELEDILKAALPDVPQHEIGVRDKIKVPAKAAEKDKKVAVMAD